MIEFKQIIGRGTRLNDRKTISPSMTLLLQTFLDPEWMVGQDDDGSGNGEEAHGEQGDQDKREDEKIHQKVTVTKGRVLELDSMVQTSWSADGKPQPMSS